MISFVTGWVKLTSPQWSACRFIPDMSPPYISSPHSGNPMYAICTRIWCVRPVSSATFRSAWESFPPTRSKCVTAR